MNYKTMNIVTISNITLNPFFENTLNKLFSCTETNIQHIWVLYEEIYNCSKSIEGADIIIVSLNFEMLYPHFHIDLSSGQFTEKVIIDDCIKRCQELYSYIKDKTSTHIIWFGFEDYSNQQNFLYGNIFIDIVGQINRDLNKLIEVDAFIDLSRLIALVGISNAYDIKGKYRWNALYSQKLISLMADEVYKQYLICTGKTKKCLVLDCDNVLWGGVLSDDGIEGIKISNNGLGRSFQDFQRFAVNMYYHGVILAICSKNDKSDVLKVFREHSGMLLREEHISCFKCNWNNKPYNIKDIAESLNIGLDTVVFVDDSIFEIESVRTMLPEVTTVLYRRDSIYNELSCFNLKKNMDLKTVKERTNTYKTDSLRYKLRKNALTYEEYISSLEMVIDIHITLSHELLRISELTQRTNKCTNGKRYSFEQLKIELSKEGYQLYTVCLTDKFSHLGIVGAIGIYKNKIDLFSLSCRALGRNVEKNMLEFVKNNKVNKIYFCNTLKNRTLLDLIDKVGLIIDNE